jgi:chorismate-pyruvate lyase
LSYWRERVVHCSEWCFNDEVIARQEAIKFLLLVVLLANRAVSTVWKLYYYFYITEQSLLLINEIFLSEVHCFYT